MKIGLIRETKDPVDNRVALDPEQAALLKRRYPNLDILVAPSPNRAFTDEEYRQEGITVTEDLSGCDLLLGVKEAALPSLLAGQHYVFFGHFAKQQAYNLPLLQTMIQKGISFSDYEYMVDAEGKRVCAFGWWAGIVGVYYTLRGYGLRTGRYTLPEPSHTFSVAQIKACLEAIELPHVKMVLTGGGRVAHGARFILEDIGALILPPGAYLQADASEGFVSTNIGSEELVRPRGGAGLVDKTDFYAHPERYESDFMRFARSSDILVSCHYWEPGEPVCLPPEAYLDPGFRIRMIGDITCDIQGSIYSTLRPSTHAAPFYDYNPVTGKEEPAFSSDRNVTVMAVDTCPNAIPRETSHYFGEMLIEHVLSPMAEGHYPAVLERATILKEGKLTQHYQYLEDFANGRTKPER